jgi:hypothetical protein
VPAPAGRGRPRRRSRRGRTHPPPGQSRRLLSPGHGAPSSK